MINHKEKGRAKDYCKRPTSNDTSAKLLKIRNLDLVPLKEFFVTWHVILICREINVWRVMICEAKVMQEILHSQFSSQEQTLHYSSEGLRVFMGRRLLSWGIQEISAVYSSSSLDTDELKMALRARKVSGTFEKRAPGREKSLYRRLNFCIR